MIEIPLGRKKDGEILVALIDDEDSEFASIPWYAHKGKGDYYYAAHRYSLGDGSRERDWLHREVMEKVIGRRLEKGELPDHINGNKLDNRRSNLRLATRSENEANKPYSRGRSKYKGVSWRKDRDRWRATIQVDGKQIALGLFKKEQDAARAYNKAALDFFGEFATLNDVRRED